MKVKELKAGVMATRCPLCLAGDVVHGCIDSDEDAIRASESDAGFVTLHEQAPCAKCGAVMPTESASWYKDDEALARYAQEIRRKVLLEAANICEHFMRPERLSDVQSTAEAIRQRIYELDCDFDHPRQGQRSKGDVMESDVCTHGIGDPNTCPDCKMLAGAVAWDAIARMHGYNEMTKQAKTLGEKVYCRMACDVACEEATRLGAEIVRTELGGQVVFSIHEVSPSIKFRESDIEGMRKAVAEWDTAHPRSDQEKSC